MPGSTPVLGLRYPFIGEPITTATFANLATDIETATNDTLTLVNAELKPQVCMITASLTQTFAQAVETTVIWDPTVDNQQFRPFRNPNGIFNAGAPTDLTIQEAGVYMVTVVDMAISSFTTLVSMRVLVYKAGVVQFGERRNENDGSSGSLQEQIQGLVVCNVGEVIQVRILWTGTGGPGTMGNLGWPQICVMKVCPL